MVFFEYIENIFLEYIELGRYFSRSWIIIVQLTPFSWHSSALWYLMTRFITCSIFGKIIGNFASFDNSSAFRKLEFDRKIPLQHRIDWKERTSLGYWLSGFKCCYFFSKNTIFHFPNNFVFAIFSRIRVRVLRQFVVAILHETTYPSCNSYKR